jgi:hypothetical protein
MYQPNPGGDTTSVTGAPREPEPATVRNAVRFMYAGAVASLIGVVVGLTQGVSKSAIHKAAPNLTTSQVNTAASLAVITSVVFGIIGIALWLVIARASARGRNWARITGTVFFALETLSLLLGLARPQVTLVKVFPILIWLIGLGAVIFLWRPDSSRYFS